MKRIYLILLFFLLLADSFSQNFGCFELSEHSFDRLHSSPDRKSPSFYDSIFWQKYTLDQYTDGYCKIYWNKYQTKMEGNIINGKREGIWKFYENDWDSRTGYEIIHIVNYSNGKKEGVYKKIRTNYKDTSLIEEGNYSNDLKEGKFIIFLNDTIISSVSNYKTGILDGVSVMYNLTKQKTNYVERITDFKNDAKNGNEIYFNVTGNTYFFSIGKYSNDTLKEAIYFNKNGDIISQNEYYVMDNKATITKHNKNETNDSNQVKTITIEKYEKKFENGSKEIEGNIIVKGKISMRDSVWSYYYKNGDLKALINYKEGKKTGASEYFDKAGKLRRIEVILDNGTKYSLFDGDTVNYSDTNGKKQGKWITLPYHFDLNENSCDDIPDEIKYYKDNQPIGKWEINYKRFYRMQSKIIYIWKDNTLAYCYYYCRDNDCLQAEGDIIDMTYKFGKWKEYDCANGYLKAEGNYYLNKKIGKWIYYKRNGKIKKTEEY